jgi:glutamate/aspartate transport system ATP-binding protein
VIDNLNLAQLEVLRRTKGAATERSMKLLERVGLADQAEKYPSALSGGQQQRVAIARALAMDPVAMLFDEPTSALDPEMINEVLDVMVGLADEGMTMMVVTHEMAFARRVADRIIFMDGGRIVEDRETNAFFTQPHTERAREFLSKILSHAVDAVI